MKKCPLCNNVFGDTNDFCLNDGTPLVGVGESSAFHTPTQVFPTPVSGGFQQPSKSISPILYLIIGVLAAGFIAALIFIFVMPDRNDETKKTRQTDHPTEKPTTNVQSPQPAVNAPSSIPGPPPADPTLTPSGSWSGDWTSDKNTSAFTAKAEFQETGGRVEGWIVWTLVRSANPQKMYKSGLTAVEYVRGTFDPPTRLMKVRGYRKDDPNNLVIYDAYNLSLSEDKQNLSGRSKNGRLRLNR